MVRPEVLVEERPDRWLPMCWVPGDSALARTPGRQLHQCAGERPYSVGHTAPRRSTAATPARPVIGQLSCSLSAGRYPSSARPLPAGRSKAAMRLSITMTLPLVGMLASEFRLAFALEQYS